MSETEERRLAALRTQLEQSDLKTRRRAAYELFRLSEPTSEVRKTAVGLLADPDVHIRLHASVAYYECDPEGPDALLPLLSVLPEATEPDMRQEILHCLGGEGERAAQAVHDIAACLRDANPNIRWTSAWAIGNLGTQAVDVLPLLIDRLADSEPIVREYACRAVGQLNPSSQSMLLQLAERLT